MVRQGAVGSAVARTFAREGARVFLAGRTLSTLDAVAEGITAAGGEAETAKVDVLDQQAVRQHADAVVEGAGRIDVSLNASRQRGGVHGLGSASAMTATVANVTCGSVVDTNSVQPCRADSARCRLV